MMDPQWLITLCAAQILHNPSMLHARGDIEDGEVRACACSFSASPLNRKLRLLHSIPYGKQLCMDVHQVFLQTMA